MRNYKRIAFFLCFSILFLNFLFGSFWTDWFEYSSNPVFDPANPAVNAYYPSVIYNLNRFNGNGLAAYYKMWFNRDESGGISLAYSDNGINWTEYSGSVALPGLAAVADHPTVVYDPGGFGGSYYYKIWYWDAGASLTSIAAIRTAESVDGVNWVNDQPIAQHATDTNLQLIHGGWGTYFYHNYGPGYVIYNSTATNTGWTTPTDKSDDVPMSFRYVLYYLVAGEGGTPNGSAEQEGLAYSVDGIYWIRYGVTPVLMGSGNSADWDYSYLYGASVVNIAGTYHMWYIGANGDGSVALPYAHGIGHATSPDGLNWTRDADNPAMHFSDGIAWRSRGMHQKSVVYDPSNFSGHGDSYPVKMWYSGVDPAGNNTIGYAWLPPTATAPNACFNAAPIEGYAPLTVNFNAGCSTDSDGTITAYNWNFGDQSVSSGINQSHTFTAAGQYVTTLTVRDNDGLTDTATRTIIVRNPLTACFTASIISGFVPFTVNFDASCSSSLSGAGIVSYNWNFGNGNTAEGMTPSFTFTEEGDKVITLVITDEEGNTQSTSQTIKASKLYPPSDIRLIREINRSLARAEAYHTLIWSPNFKNTAFNIERYNIYRRNTSDPADTYKLIGSSGRDSLEFIEKVTPVTTIYAYYITTVLMGGFESSPSTVVQNTN